MGSAVTGSDRMDILHFFLPKGAEMALMEEPWPVKAASPLGLSFPLLGEAFKPHVFIASGGGCWFASPHSVRHGPCALPSQLTPTTETT